MYYIFKQERLLRATFIRTFGEKNIEEKSGHKTEINRTTFGCRISHGGALKQLLLQFKANDGTFKPVKYCHTLNI